jgi:hypothetical protein
MRKCTGTGYDIDHCRVEKMGCPGCHHYKKEVKFNGQKISKRAKYKGHKTN